MSRSSVHLDVNACERNREAKIDSPDSINSQVEATTHSCASDGYRASTYVVRVDTPVSLEDDRESKSSNSQDKVYDADKPNQSYISLIANAILASPEKRLVLSDIYSYVLEKHPFFRDKGAGWRNSVRHNLSLNECFVKAGRSPNGKGHFWAINPANFEDFSKGDFRRRRAQRRARRAMLHEPSNDRPCGYPASQPLLSPDLLFPYMIHPYHSYLPSRLHAAESSPISVTDLSNRLESLRSLGLEQTNKTCKSTVPVVKTQTPKRKRGFDVESLLREDKSDEERESDKTTKMTWSSSKPLRVQACDTDWGNRRDVRNLASKPQCNSCNCVIPLSSNQCSMPNLVPARLVPPYPVLQPSSSGLSRNLWLAEHKYK